MRTKQGLARGKAAALAVVFGTFLLLSASQAQGVLLFWENFEGYTRFPDQKPYGDRVNLGLPESPEGASELWYGGRYGWGGGSLGSDLGVQRAGGNGNYTRVGRMGDRAGLLLRIGTTGYDNVQLSFDWRTFLAEGDDKFRAGYYVGDLAFGGDRMRNFNFFGPAWPQWTQLTTGKANTWHHAEHTLPGGAEDLWVALWMDGGDLDFAKVDNIRIDSGVTEPVPEPASLMLLGGGLLALAAGGMRRRARS
jgi:hypothetical protein